VRREEKEEEEKNGIDGLIYPFSEGLCVLSSDLFSRYSTLIHVQVYSNDIILIHAYYQPMHQ
jgi:hypothetical protein